MMNAEEIIKLIENNGMCSRFCNDEKDPVCNLCLRYPHYGKSRTRRLEIALEVLKEYHPIEYFEWKLKNSL